MVGTGQVQAASDRKTRDEQEENRLSPQEWDDFVIAEGGHLLQSWGWGEFKKRFGWEVERFVIWDEVGSQPVGVAQVLLRDLPLSKMAYVPKGPVVDSEDEGAWKRLLTMLVDFGRQERVTFLKVEPDQEEDLPLAELLTSEGFRLAEYAIQPRNTIVVSLVGDLEEILMRMKPKTRYNIRLSERKGVTVREGGEEDIPVFYRLLKATGERDDWGVHEEEYYLQAWRIFAPEERLKLLLAYYGEELLAGLMVFAFGSRAWYLYGASSDRHRNRMPNHLLQWRAMCWAKERGCSSYDLWGIPEEAGLEQEEDMEALLDRGGLWGVYRFKRGFGGRPIRCTSYDYVYSRLLYWLGMKVSPWLRGG
jgi:peptidoglycan pentaglycine glycine transferase (the first glycine)